MNKLRNFSDSFNEIINYLVIDGILRLNDLNDHDQMFLTGAYIRDNEKDHWEFITESPNFECLPDLLIDIMFDYPATAKINRKEKINTMIKGDMEWCKEYIETAFDEAIAKKENEHD